MKAYRFLLSALFAAAFVGVAPIAQAASDHDHGAAQPATHTGTGVVRSVDASAPKIKVAHDPIKSLDWPAMVMDFKVKDAKALQGLKAGDKVEFTLESVGGQQVISRIKAK